MKDELTITWKRRPVEADSDEWEALVQGTSIDLGGPSFTPVTALVAVFPPVEGWRVGMLRGASASLIALCQEALGEVLGQPHQVPLTGVYDRATAEAMVAIADLASDGCAGDLPGPLGLGELCYLIASSRRLRRLAEASLGPSAQGITLISPAYFAAALPPSTCNLPITPAAGGAVPIAHVDQPSRRGSMGAFGLPAADRGAAFIRQERHHG